MLLPINYDYRGLKKILYKNGIYSHILSYSYNYNNFCEQLWLGSFQAVVERKITIIVIIYLKIEKVFERLFGVFLKRNHRCWIIWDIGLLSLIHELIASSKFFIFYEVYLQENFKKFYDLLIVKSSLNPFLIVDLLNSYL